MLSEMTTCSSGLPDELLQRLPRQCRHGGPTVRCEALGPFSHRWGQAERHLRRGARASCQRRSACLPRAGDLHTLKSGVVILELLCQAGGIVLGFLQGKDDIDGFYQRFHGDLE